MTSDEKFSRTGQVVVTIA